MCHLYINIPYSHWLNTSILTLGSYVSTNPAMLGFIEGQGARISSAAAAMSEPSRKPTDDEVSRAETRTHTINALQHNVVGKTGVSPAHVNHVLQAHAEYHCVSAKRTRTDGTVERQ